MLSRLGEWQFDCLVKDWLRKVNVNQKRESSIVYKFITSECFYNACSTIV